MPPASENTSREHARVIDRSLHDDAPLIGICTTRTDRDPICGFHFPIHFHYILAGSVGLIFHQAEECKRLIGADPFDEAIVEEHARAVEYLFLGPPDQEKP